MIRPGARNLITDVPSILVGNAEGHAARSGVTVVLPEAGAVCAVDVRGGAPGTRETDALDPAGLIEVVHAVVLSGGSAFGLDAAGGAMAWLAARGQGFRAADARIPIVRPRSCSVSPTAATRRGAICRLIASSAGGPAPSQRGTSRSATPGRASAPPPDI